AAPHCQSFDLSPRAGGGQAQAVRGRTAVDGFLLLGDRADSAREVRGSRVESPHSLRRATEVEDGKKGPHLRTRPKPGQFSRLTGQIGDTMMPGPATHPR